MSYREILINPLNKVDHASITETEIGEKILYTPTSIPKIKTNMDFDLICTNPYLEEKTSAVCFNINSVKSIYQERRKISAQFTLEMESVDKGSERIFKEVPIIIDPMTELFYYDMKTRTNGQPMRNTIFDLGKFPEKLKELFSKSNSKNHNIIWNKVKDSNLTLSLLDWYITTQTRYKADIILPPTPMIDGSSSLMMKFAEQINNYSREIVAERTSAYSAFYLPLHYRIFSNSKALKELKNIISKNSLLHRILVLKIIWYDYLKTKDERVGFQKLLTKIDKIKSDIDNNLLVILLDSKSEGFITLANGVDAYVEPMDSQTYMKRGKRINKGNEDLSELRTQHGAYLHPDSREYKKFTKLFEEYENNGQRLPCPCKACEEYHGNLSYKTSTLKWNKSRRVHAINVRKREIKELISAINDNTPKDIVFRIMRGGDKNYVDLLPY